VATQVEEVISFKRTPHQKAEGSLKKIKVFNLNSFQFIFYCKYK
jgi:hypothetical protein